MAFVVAGQVYTVDMPTWIAGYREGLDRYDGNKQKAINYADNIVEQTQGSGAVKDLARLQRENEATKTMAAMFGTYIIGVLYPKMRELGIDTSKGYAARSALTLIPLIFLPALLEGLWRDPPEDDEAWLPWFLSKSMFYGSSGVPFFGDLLEATFGEYDYSVSPVESPINMAIRGIKSDDIDAQAKGIMAGVNMLTGAPVYKPYLFADEMIDQASGREDFNFLELLQLKKDMDE
jgi:hypothetical protein